MDESFSTIPTTCVGAVAAPSASGHSEEDGAAAAGLMQLRYGSDRGGPMRRVSRMRRMRLTRRTGGVAWCRGWCPIHCNGRALDNLDTPCCCWTASDIFPKLRHKFGELFQFNLDSALRSTPGGVPGVYDLLCHRVYWMTRMLSMEGITDEKRAGIWVHYVRYRKAAAALYRINNHVVDVLNAQLFAAADRTNATLNREGAVTLRLHRMPPSAAAPPVPLGGAANLP